MFRCAELLGAARQGPGLPLHLHRPGGHVAPPSSRSTAATGGGYVDRRRRHADALGRGRRPRGDHARAWAATFDYEILSIMPWVRRELVADRYGTRPRVHRRRRRASDVADRRLRHEHRHSGRGRSRLEARGRASKGWGGAGAARVLRGRAPAGRPCAMSPRRAGNLAACCRPAHEPAGAGDLRARRGRATRRARSSAAGSPR